MSSTMDTESNTWASFSASVQTHDCRCLHVCMWMCRECKYPVAVLFMTILLHLSVLLPGSLLEEHTHSHTIKSDSKTLKSCVVLHGKPICVCVAGNLAANEQICMSECVLAWKVEQTRLWLFQGVSWVRQERLRLCCGFPLELGSDGGEGRGVRARGGGQTYKSESLP